MSYQDGFDRLGNALYPHRPAAHRRMLKAVGTWVVGILVALALGCAHLLDALP